MVHSAERSVQRRGYIGILLAILSAICLALILVRMQLLGRELGLDRGAVMRERTAVAEMPKIFAVVKSFDAYRNALAVHTADVGATRAQADAAFTALGNDMLDGQATMLGLHESWRHVATAWAHAKTLPRDAHPMADLQPTMTALSQFTSDVSDASGLTYDPSLVAQNLANVYLQETPFAYSALARMQTMLDLFARSQAMTLEQRLALDNSVNGLVAASDFSGDSLSAVTAKLTAEFPQRRAEFDDLIRQTNALTQATHALTDLVSRTALLTNAPTQPQARYDRLAMNARALTVRVNDLSGRILDDSLIARGDVQETRNRYFYLAWVAGAGLLAGVMIIIAQLIARRDRLALSAAQQESARLQAELARQEAEEALRLSEAQFRAVFDGAAIGIAIYDRAGTIVDSNEVYRTMFVDASPEALRGYEREVGELFDGERETFEFETQHRSTAGHEVWADVTVSIVNDEHDAPRFVICMFRDKTALKHSERRMQHDKLHDALTGLPNRQMFDESLRRRFEESGTLLDSFFAVLFVDLEHFKDVNESMGHAAGDVVLTQIATRLRAAVDSRDIVARLGSDEFAVLVQSLGDILHVESLARRILNNLSKPVTIGAKTVYLGASVGIAIGPASYDRAENVMRDAEIAMAHAKSGGSTRYALFDSKMQQRTQKRIELTNDLRLAIERNQFRMLYQPIIRLSDSAVVGCEALIRWDHPTEGMIGPTDFIGLAEQTGLAAPIGRFVLETAASQLGAWRRTRGAALDFDMHVNISASELTDPDFERFLIQIVEHHGLTPSLLTIEITESLVLDSAHRVSVILERLRNRGFRLCIDDFGTGYSSLRYLQQFKVDAIKIDRTFVSGADGDLASEPIVRTLMTLAEAYNVRVVAEGVETARQREMLRAAGCRLAQGYLFAHPMTAAEMVERYPEALGRVSRPASA